MGDNKTLQVAGGLLLFLFLPLIIVIALLLGSLSGIGSASDCAPVTGGTGKSFGWPTDKHDIAQGWDSGDPKHTGLDYDVAAGSAVHAAADGEVVSVDGDWIKIKHDAGVETWYEFFQSKKVHVGDKVKRGDEVGKSGSGNEDDPGKDGDHLHFELRIKKGGSALEPVDPTNEIGDAEAAASSGGGCGCGGGLTGTNNEQKIFNFLVSNGYTKEQAAGVLGNIANESGGETTLLQNTTAGTVTHAKAAMDSPLGWGIVQWTPAGKMIKPSLQSGADETTIESLEFQVNFLKDELDGKGPAPEAKAGQSIKAAKSVDEAVVAFGRDFERFKNSQDPNNPQYNERKKAAAFLLQQFGGGTGGGASPAAGCAGNGSISATAIGLAWPTPGGHGKNKADATKAYQDAMPKFNGSSGDDEYSDCGVFVATVMRMSGADPDYPTRSTGVQENYLRNSGKYDVMDLPLEQLQPGDIMIGPGHTFLIVDPQGPYKAAAASLHDHVPEMAYAYVNDGGKHFSAARLKKK